MSGSKRVIQIIPAFSLAGAERMCEHLSCELVRRGWNVVAASMYDERTEITREMEAAGVRMVFLGKKHGPDLSMVSKIRNLVRAEAPSVVHTHLYCMQYAPFACFGLDAAQVHTVHNLAEREVPARLRAIQGRCFRSGRCVPVAINEAVRSSICTLYRLDSGRVPMVYNGVPVHETYADVCLPGDPDAFSFLNVGRATNQKNQLALVEAFAKFHAAHPATKLVLAGDGELFDELGRRIRRLGADGYVFQTGLLADVRDWYGAVDAFCLPSLYEGMPMTLIEAMMAGLPVLASDRGGSPDMVVDGRTGYLCEPDVDGIVRGLERLYTDSDRGRVARAGRESSERYTMSAMADGYESVYAGVSRLRA